MILKILENFFQQTTTGVMAMKFSLKIVSKNGQALKLSGMEVEIRGMEFLSIRNAILQYSEEDGCFMCETHDFTTDEEVKLFISGERMCHTKNGETIIVTTIYEDRAPLKPRRKKACFIGKKA